VPGSIVIAGARGFIGRHAVAEFRHAGWRVVSLARDGAGEGGWPFSLPDPRATSMIADLRPNVILNVTGTALIGASFENPCHDFQENVAVTVTLLDAARLVPGCRFVQLSSAAVYGNPECLPIDEATPLRPISPYGFHKWQAEMACREFALIYGIPVSIVRLFSAYGPGLRRQVIWDLTRRLAGGGSITIAGTGLEERDFLHVRDVAGALRRVVERVPGQPEIYNLASGQSRPIASLAETLARRIPGAARWEFGGSMRPGNPEVWRVDVRRLASIGFHPQVDWESGIEETVDWILRESAPTPIP